MKSLKLFAALLFLLTFGLGIATAQSDRGTVRGTITDPNNAVIAGAKVVLTSIDSSETREVTSTDDGIFVFPEVKAGLYRMNVEATGFKRTSVDNIKVDVQGIQSLAVKLEIGEISGNVVNVNAEAVAINSDTPVRQTTVTERQVRELPLQVSSEAGGRTPLAFIFLDSNVGATDQTGNTNSSNFKVSGGQGAGTEILIDGASTRRTQNGTFFTEVAPGPNAYQEFTISTNSYSAEFGNSSGGIVNFTLKSGTNQFHGEGYDLLRNEDLNANSLFNNANGFQRNRDNENNYGFNIGGPIYIPNFGEGTPGGFLRSLKDKAFFFFNYEGYRFIQGVHTLQSVPTVRERTGDFGELLTDPYVLSAFGGPIRIYDPHQPSSTRSLIPGNRLDLYTSPVTGRSVIDPAGLAILQFYPLPTRPGIHNNYESSIVIPQTSNQFTTKEDFNLTEKQHLTFSFSWRDNTRLAGDPPVLPLPYVQAFGPFNQTFKSYIGRIQHDYTITPKLLNHFNVGYTYYDVKNGNTTLGFDTSSLGIPANATSNASFPLIDFVGDGNNGNSPRFTTDIGSTDFSDHLKDGALELSDFVTYIAGRQTLKFGANVRIAQFNAQQLIHPGGRFGFHEAETHLDSDPNSGSPLASLVTGATEWSFVGNDTVDPAFRQLSQSYFVQDDFKLTQKLTLNLGLRYDLPGLRTEAHDRFRTFDPNAINPVIGIKGAIAGAAGQGGVQAQFRTLAPVDKTDIGPRLGAAYALNNKTVLRGGIGLYYSPILYGVGGSGSVKDGTIGYNNDDINPRPNGNQTPENQFLSNFRSLNSYGVDVSGTSQFVGVTAQAIPYFDQNFKTGRTLQYTFDIQRELPYRLVGSIGYIGHHADRLRSNFGRLNALPLNDLKLGFEILTTNINNVTAAQRAYATSIGINIPANGNAVYNGFNDTVAQALKPFPQYGQIQNFLESQGKSNYNAMQVKLDRRFAQGFQFGLSYTLSRLKTDASEDILGGSPLSGTIQNPFDRASLYTISPTNPTHVFVANFLAELPFGKGKRFLNQGGIVDAIFGGFQVSGIFRYQSGLPLIFGVSSDTGHAINNISNFLDLVGYLGNLRPNLTGQPINTVGPCNPNVPANVDRQYVLNCAAFALPPDFTNPGQSSLLANGQINPAYVSYYSDPTRFFGNAPAVDTDVHSNPFFSENMSILKKTRFTETVSFEIGAEFFNIFNRTRYIQPDAFLGSFRNGAFDNTNFGAQGEVGSPRVIQLRARIIF